MTKIETELTLSLKSQHCVGCDDLARINSAVDPKQKQNKIVLFFWKWEQSPLPNLLSWKWYNIY